MTGRIIHLHGEDHDHARGLLPWYVTGRLDAVEQAKVEAHLSVCADCQAEARAERRLCVEVAGLPIGVEHGWEQLRRRIERNAPRRPPLAVVRAWLGARNREAAGAWRAGPGWLRLAIAAQFCGLLILGGILLPGVRPAAQYHVLGARPSGAGGNLVVIFHPETTERDLRRTLEASDAQLAAGPNAAGAYLLRVPQARRGAVLASLRHSLAIELAEPVDAAASP
jgi:hypothetical protein